MDEYAETKSAAPHMELGKRQTQQPDLRNPKCAYRCCAGTCCHWKANFGEVIPFLEKNFYAAKMGEQYLERYKQHFKAPDIRKHEMQHEELLVCYPGEWACEIEKCCN